MTATLHPHPLPVLLLLLLLLGGPAPALGQQTDGPVTVNLFPIRNEALQRTIERNAGAVLTALNTSSEAPATALAGNAAAELAALAATYRTRRSVYNALLVRQPTREPSYEIRGLHLAHQTDGIEGHPQGLLQIDAEGRVTGISIVDDALRADHRSELRENVGRFPHGVEVLELVLSLEAAYNRPDPTTILDELDVLLADAQILVSRLMPSGQDRLVPKRGSDYVNALRRAFNNRGGKTPEVTFERINIYPAREDSMNLYRVTLLQHWYYDSPHYSDTDYISLDVVFNGDDDITVRRAGRGGFHVESTPTGATIARVNARTTDFQTPHFFQNAPAQYHYLTIDEPWYEEVDLTATDENVTGLDTLRATLVHRPAAIRVTVDPSDSELHVNDGLRSDFQSGAILPVPVADLIGAMDRPVASGGRDVTLRLSRPYYADTVLTVTLPSPDPYDVNIVMRRLQGDLNVTAIPEGSLVYVNGEPVGPAPLTTRLDVTGDDRPPYQVSVRNDECAPDAPEETCILYIPSEERPVVISQDQPADESFVLVPFHVRNTTDDAELTAELDRSGDSLYVGYNLTDTRGRNRRYTVDLYLEDQAGRRYPLPDGATACPDAEGADCLGGGVRPGAHTLLWTMDAVPEGTYAVLEVSRRKKCWACVALPLAAGAAAAILIPRTGSGGSGLPFLPPPRPE